MSPRQGDDARRERAWRRQAASGGPLAPLYRRLLRIRKKLAKKEAR